MKSHIQLGRVLGIRIGLHYSWFLIALLLVVSFSGSFNHRYPGWNWPSVLALGLLTTLVFFVSLLLHELAHSITAIRYGLRVREITLFALGGVSRIEGEMPGAASEFWIAVVGPLTSAVIGIACIVLADFASPGVMGAVATMLSWIGYINLSLAVFNVLPGYPMDGGRILRSLLWWKWGNLDRATRVAARTGTVLAVGFIALGILDFFRGRSMDGLWIALIGWFLLEASRDSYLEVGLREELHNIRVSDLMVTDPATVDGHATVQEFVDRDLLRTARRCFVVQENGIAVGVVTPHDVHSVVRAAWPTTPVDRVMHPLQSLCPVQPDSSLLDALQAMGQGDLNEVPVLHGNRCVGILSRAEVVAYLQNRSELQSCG